MVRARLRRVDVARRLSNARDAEDAEGRERIDGTETAEREYERP